MARLLTFLLLLTACGGTPAVVEPVDPPRTGPDEVELGDPPLGQLPEGVEPIHYELALTIVPDEDRFSGTTRIRIRNAEARRYIWLHGRDLSVSNASVTPAGGDPIGGQWRQVDEEGVVALILERELPPGEATIEVAYEADFDRALAGLYRVDTGGESYAFTQMEAISARKAFPGFDEPRFKTPFDVTLTVREDHVAAANTLPVAEEAVGGGMKQVRYATTEKLPTYLIAWAVGPLDVVEAPPIPASSVRERELPFRGLAAKGQGERLQYALEHTPALLRSLEEYFDSEYPYDKLDIVAVPDFGAGAMENVGLVTFREWLLLLDPETATEGQKRAFAYVMAHELAHMWFGNLVTMPWWDDIWLNEAFATWMGNKTVRDVFPDYKAELSFMGSMEGAMQSDSLTTARQIRQPIESSHDIRNAFDRITYSKGGAVLEMFERWMGPEAFRDGIRRHMVTHRFGVADVNDLLTSLSTAAERDVGTPFRTFLFQSGVPFLHTEVSCGDDGEPHLAVRQERYLPVGSEGERARTWQLPVCIRYSVGGDIEQTCELVTEAEAQIDFEGDACPEWVMPNADGAGYYRFAMAPDDLTALRGRGWDDLTGRERIAFANSLAAAFNAAAVEPEALFPMLEALARDELRQVSGTPMGIVSWARDRVADDELDPRVEAWGRRLYQGAYRRLGWEPRRGRDEDGETRLERAQVISFLAFTAQDERVRREAARRGRAYVGFGGDGELHPDAVEANVVDTALAVAVEEGDAELFEHLLSILVDSEDATIRSRMLSALSHTKDPELAARARGLALDERIRSNEMMTPLWTQLGMEETREATWQWITESFDALVERLSLDRAGSLPWMAANFCDAEKAAAAEAFFRPHVEEMPGAPRNLAGALEASALCVARVEAQGDGVRAYFSR